MDGNVFYNLHTDSEYSNPFTGYHLMLMPAFDLTANLTPDIIFTKEWISYINAIYLNQQAISDTVFRDHSLICLGSAYDHFGVGRVLSISTNPATVPLLTYSTKKNENIQPKDSPDPAFDNRTIMLNGLYIEILDTDQDGNARIKILFNHWDVENDVRWTGDILLHDTLLLQAGSTLRLESGSMIKVRGSGKVLVESGSRIEGEEGAQASMENVASEMIFMPGSTASICPAIFRGKGKIKN